MLECQIRFLWLLVGSVRRAEPARSVVSGERGEIFTFRAGLTHISLHQLLVQSLVQRNVCKLTEIDLNCQFL